MKSSWDRRIDRAVELAGDYPFAREVLDFYVALTRYQMDIYRHLKSMDSGRASIPSLKGELPLGVLYPCLEPFIALVSRKGPPDLARAAEGFYKMEKSTLAATLQSYWRDKTLSRGGDPIMVFFTRAFLQPYAEYLAERDGTEKCSLAGAPILCPLCNSRPQVGCLRPADNGSRRFLVCSLCQTEWFYSRLSCPACGSATNNKCPYYTSEDYPHIRIEVCDTCRRYIKTIDLSRDSRAVPVVDELATIPLDLWAREQGYKKVEDNVLGI